jgi:PIN domain nuclease of toxin-antitoxin system
LISHSRRSDLIISDIVLLEISDLGTKGRIEDADGMEILLVKVAESFRMIPITPDIARLALELDLPHGDPFDRIQVIQARHRGLDMISRDPVFDRYGLRRVW